MQFSKLRLVGFKSFADQTDVLIAPGLTGVIGPNGCGKSNLVEALRWVMGDASYKSMRASGMDDVIFAGGGDRSARDMAEVALTLDNMSRSAPSPFTDADTLEVIRRIVRGKGSTYRINGREVRARDVQVLFADASTGSRSPSLVRQGQISEIIAAKPQARRRILEEAAGIAGLHNRRQEAELRLKGAEENLSRIDDVLIHLSSQGDGLRRQARQAQRYRELQATMRRHQALAVLLDYEDAEREMVEARSASADAFALVMETTRLQEETAREQALAAHALPRLRDEEALAATALQKLVVARETLEGEERRSRSRFEELERQIKDIEADLAREEATITDATRMLTRLADEATSLAVTAGSTALETELRTAVSLAQAHRSSIEADLAQAQTAHAEAKAARRMLEDRLKEEAGRFRRLEQEVASTLTALPREEDLPTLDEATTAAAARMAATQAVAAEAENAAAAADLALTRARRAEAVSREPLAEADRTVQRLETEARTLAKLLEGDRRSRWRPVADAVVVSKGYETALGAALGDDLTASIDSDAPSHWSEIPASGREPNLPEGVRSLLGVVDAPAALQRRLAQIGLVDRDAAAGLMTSLQVGQTLVSREGDLWRWDGFVQAAEAPTPAARRLAERNRLGDLRLDMDAARGMLAEFRREAERAQGAMQEAIDLERDARRAATAARTALSQARDDLAGLERRRDKTAARLAQIEAAGERARDNLREAAANRIDLEARLAALPPAGHLAAAVETAQAELAAVQRREAEASASLAAEARERDMRIRRRASIEDDSRSWKARQARASEHVEVLCRRLSAAMKDREALFEAPERIAAARRGILREIDTAESALRSSSAARSLGEAVLLEADRKARSAGEAMASARESKARSEARNEAAIERHATLTRTIAADLGCSPDALAALAGVAASGQRPTAAHVAGMLDILKADRAALGAVNLRAEEEFAALQSRQSSLDREKADIVEAIRRLRAAVVNLNKEGRERLLDAFGTVNGHFKDLFTGLFGGGTAELQFVESDDPLEAGLEILACPPGKKPQVMTLLSGGEQALTAMSLIFAVFLTNPSPICVLDEVDAPLDDANVERFCDLVDTIRSKTQTRFIAITHNPITMARMDRLFGVTQALPGVSQLVSVNLQDAGEIQAAY